jgi:glycosyltransferase involved in cell wall biosynthesis
MCLTYGRPHILEESLESFLKQDYRGEMEMIILNDLPEQTLRFEHPSVRVINVTKRFRTVGEKRNACAALCSHDWLLPWDDDDIYLPWRISYSMEMMNIRRRFFKSTAAFVFSNGKVKEVLKSVFHAGSCWHRTLFDEVQGYPHLTSGEDIAIEKKFAEVLGDEHLGLEGIAPERMYYVYRWAGTGSYHLSAFGQTRTTKSEYALVADYVCGQLASGKVPSGEILLSPHWNDDYLELVSGFLMARPVFG